MSHKQNRVRALLPECDQPGPKAPCRWGIKGDQRLVHEEEVGIDCKGPDQRDAPVHADRERLWELIRYLLETDRVDEAVDLVGVHSRRQG